MPLTTSISALRGLFPVQPRQSGGYDRYRIPDPNDPAALYGNMANPSGDPSHVAGGMSANEYNALLAERARGRSEDARQDARARGGLDRVVQGLKSVGTSRNWDAFFGALQNQGVDRLQTGAAAGLDRGPSLYDMRTGATYTGPRPGFFDTQVAPQQYAYDPRTAQAGGPADSPYQQQQGHVAQAAQQALSGLIQSPYEPSAPVARSGYGAGRLNRARYLDMQDANRERR